MPNVSANAWYAAFKAKDARFDGRFFVGVSSTGIYCRPVCKARLPKAGNCTYYDSAAAAEQAGFRPCLLCRPELAPGNAPVDATLSLAHKAARLLEEQCGSGQNLDELMQKLGCSARHLRRAFTAEYNVSPVRYLQTCRLLLAKNLLTDTDLSVTDVAMAAGFGSLRRFNDLFKTQYRLAPTALRRQVATEKGGRVDVTLRLGYRPPYQWRQLLAFLSARAIPGVEIVADNAYARTVHCVSAAQKNVSGWVRVGHLPHKNALSVTVDSALLPVLPHVLSRIRHLFDLYCAPASIAETLSAMDTVRPGLCVTGTRLPGCMEPFEVAVSTALGQRMPLTAASILTGRLAESLGASVAIGIDGLTHTFPAPATIAALQGGIEVHLGPLGISASQARTILALAEAFVAGRIDAALYARPEAAIQTLLAIEGIGPDAAQGIAMRAMGWPDAFPGTDCGLKKMLSPLSESEIAALAEAWRPWRSYAVMTIWNYLDAQKE